MSLELQGLPQDFRSSCLCYHDVVGYYWLLVVVIVGCWLLVVGRCLCWLFFVFVFVFVAKLKLLLLNPTSLERIASNNSA